MKPEHLQAMQEGRRRKAALRRTAGQQRVADFTAWLKAGSVLRDIPEIPKDADYVPSSDVSAHS